MVAQLNDLCMYHWLFVLIIFVGADGHVMHGREGGGVVGFLSGYLC